MSNTFESSPYVILVNDDNSMTITKKRRIVQRSKLVDDLWFLINPNYNSHDMSEFTVLLEYLSPVSRKYRTEILVLNESTYNGYLKYTLPFDTTITAEAGDVELLLTFLHVGLNENGKDKQRVRKISGATINIVPLSAWCDIIPDEALSALDRRIIKTDAQIKALNDIGDTLYRTKADDISYNEDSNELQLLADGIGIGKKVFLGGSEEQLKDGVPIVDFSTVSGGADDPDEEDDVVEF